MEDITLALVVFFGMFILAKPIYELLIGLAEVFHTLLGGR